MTMAGDLMKPGLPPEPRILVIALRRLGDVLLTTPLVRSLKRGLPGARVDMLVFRGTEGMLAGNPDIDAVTAVATRPSLVETHDLIHSLWRRYDLAVSTQTGDRPTFLAFVAGRRRAGLVPAAGGGAWWKRRVLNLCVTADPDSHRVVELLQLARALDLALAPELVPPGGAFAEAVLPHGRYAVLHANPLYRFRRWTDEGWRVLARALAERGQALAQLEEALSQRDQALAQRDEAAAQRDEAAAQRDGAAKQRNEAVKDLHRVAGEGTELARANEQLRHQYEDMIGTRGAAMVGRNAAAPPSTDRWHARRLAVAIAVTSLLIVTLAVIIILSSH